MGQCRNQKTLFLKKLVHQPILHFPDAKSGIGFLINILGVSA
jgi:hypothetical protein